MTRTTAPAAPAVRINGSGLAEVTCAWLLAARGHRVRLQPRPSHGPRPLLLAESTLALLGSLWQLDPLTELVSDAHRVTHRHARWGQGPDEPPVPQPGAVVDGARLSARLLARLADRHPHAVSDEPADGDSADSDSADGDSVRWTVTATAQSTDAHWTAGRRHLLAGEVTLAPGQDATTTRLTCTDLAWLHLTPLGAGRALLQAMVPGPAEGPTQLLNRLLATSTLASGVRHPVAHAVAVPAAPRLHRTPAVVPTARAPGLLLVGAGAIRYDPLSGTGTAQALRTAVLATAVIHAAARGAPPGPLCTHFTTRLRTAFHDHLATCALLYPAAFPDPSWRYEIGSGGGYGGRRQGQLTS